MEYLVNVDLLWWRFQNACVIPSSAEIEKLEKDINTLKEAGGELTI